MSESAILALGFLDIVDLTYGCTDGCCLEKETT
jgi:hypothetical protein